MDGLLDSKTRPGGQLVQVMSADSKKLNMEDKMKQSQHSQKAEHGKPYAFQHSWIEHGTFPSLDVLREPFPSPGAVDLYAAGACLAQRVGGLRGAPGAVEAAGGPLNGSKH